MDDDVCRLPALEGVPSRICASRVICTTFNEVRTHPPGSHRHTTVRGSAILPDDGRLVLAVAKSRAFTRSGGAHGRPRVLRSVVLPLLGAAEIHHRPGEAVRVVPVQAAEYPDRNHSHTYNSVLPGSQLHGGTPPPPAEGPHPLPQTALDRGTPCRPDGYSLGVEGGSGCHDC